MTEGPGKAPRSGRRTNNMRHASPRLYGREHDIAIIEGLIDRVRDGGSALVISGEPGIGKSALLKIAQDIARERGLRLLTLCGVTSEAHLPFGGLQQALRSILRQSAALPARQRAALQAALGLSDDTTAPDVFLVGLATLTLLAESATGKPILILADDVHWLDEPSREVLAFLARRISSDPIVLLMSTRSGTEEPLTLVNVPRHELRGLDAFAAEQLLDAEARDLPHDLRRRFLDDAAGNPLALVELPRGEMGRESFDFQWLPLTDRLERTFFARVSDLPMDTRTLLQIVAENDSKSLREVLEAGQILLGKKVGLEALAPAVSAMLVELAAGEVSFRHPLVRSAVHQAASPILRHHVHAALGQVIEDRSGRAIWHRMASAIGPDEALATELDAAAVRSQRRGVLSNAIVALENAARLSGTAVARSERLLRAAGFAAHLGQPATVERLLREAELDEPQPQMRAHFAWVREISQPLTVSDPARISALARFAADARADGASELALDLLQRAAQRCWWSNASNEVRADIFAAAAQLGFPASDARIIAIAGFAGPLPHGHEIYRQLAAHAAVAVEDPRVAWILGIVANSVGAFEFSIGWFTTASVAFREQGRLGDLARVLFGHCCAEIETGDWAGALKSSAEAARFGEEAQQMMWVAAAATAQAMLAARRGQFDAAETYSGQADRLLPSHGTGFWRAILQDGRGIAALGNGRPAEAYEHLRRIWAPGDPAFNVGSQFYCLADFVEAAASCGQEEAAALAVQEIERRSGPMPVPWVRMILSLTAKLSSRRRTRPRNFFRTPSAPTYRLGRSDGVRVFSRTANGYAASAVRPTRDPRFARRATFSTRWAPRRGASGRDRNCAPPARKAARVPGAFLNRCRPRNFRLQGSRPAACRIKKSARAFICRIGRSAIICTGFSRKRALPPEPD
jgi:tetratricopeptide (TPR) repeat protein